MIVEDKIPNHEIKKYLPNYLSSKNSSLSSPQIEIDFSYRLLKAICKLAKV
ncbi:MAG TPA: hypothetical protein PL130_05485 [Dictyoglomaceae bacterium]|nr:hypothetical protein [Dictyoglomaceae bacterium]